MIASLPGQQLSNNNILTYTWKNCLEPRGKLKLESRNDSSQFPLPLHKRKQHRSLGSLHAKRAWKPSTTLVRLYRTKTAS